MDKVKEEMLEYCKKRGNLRILCVSYRRGRFLMWLLFICHLLDTIGAGFLTRLPYWQRDNRATTAGSEKESGSGGGTNRLCLQPKKRRIFDGEKCRRFVAQLPAFAPDAATRLPVCLAAAWRRVERYQFPPRRGRHTQQRRSGAG